jgi:hypothetical protein
LPLVAGMWEKHEDESQPNKFVGFCEYVR